MRWPILSVLVASLLSWSASADQYWIAWEGDDFPENQGWTRVWGNWDGQYEGPGAIRTLENGILTYDSLYDDGVYDFSEMYRPGQMDSGSGELFVMEWRLNVEQVDSWYGDPGVVLSSDEAWVVGLRFAYDRISKSLSTRECTTHIVSNPAICASTTCISTADWRVRARSRSQLGRRKSHGVRVSRGWRVCTIGITSALGLFRSRAPGCCPARG
jgi:hypothetical protein